MSFTVLSIIMMRHLLTSDLFFFNDTATTEIYTLSLHDALPISRRSRDPAQSEAVSSASVFAAMMKSLRLSHLMAWVHQRSEEHTSELESQSNLVCRLLLEKKKNKRTCLSYQFH